MQPNLKLRNATLLRFSTTLSLSGDLVSKIQDSSHPDKDGDSIFLDSYKGHRALSVVRGINKDIRDFETEFVYQTARGGRLSKSLPRIEQLINVLSLVKEELNFECLVSFTFGKSLHPRPIISLPMNYIEVPNKPFDEIQGLHLVKLDGGETKYDVFLEAPTQGVLVENIAFKYQSKVDRSLADKILQEGNTISDKFVSKEYKHAPKAE